MGLLNKAIKQGLNKGLNEVIGKAVQQLDQAAAQQPSQQVENTVKPKQEESSAASALGGFFAGLEKSAKNFATEISKDMKICPECGRPAGKEQQFCPECGAKLPEETVAEGAVCPNCGKQNSIGTKFCQDCGTKLPAAEAEEKAALEKDAEVMGEWAEKLGAFPEWTCGGSKYNIEMYDSYYVFTAYFPQGLGAREAIEQYRQLLQANDFGPAGQYPTLDHLYKKYNGRCLHVDLEHCFEGDAEWPTVGFDLSEPTGGIDYVKPEPKKVTGLKDLFKL